MKVLVFRDIKNKRWTLYTPNGKHHVGYSFKVLLKDCSFVVDKKLHNGILKSKKRRPCAWVVGTLTSIRDVRTYRKSIYFWPFEKQHNFVKKSGKPIKTSKSVFFSKNGQCLTR